MRTSINEPNFFANQYGSHMLYGYNQGWYHTTFKRMGGCGPTAAAMLLSYRYRNSPQIKFPVKGSSREAVVRFMDEVWNYVTPGFMGLNTTEKFKNGVVKFSKNQQLDLTCQCLEIPSRQKNRLSWDGILQFLKEAISMDKPVAFLNLHAGTLRNLESWHWVVLIAVQEEKDDTIAVCLDQGEQKNLKLSEWYKTTKKGGGFVVLQ